MKKSTQFTLVGISVFIMSAVAYISYRLGYCAARDYYVDASECKSSRRLNFFSR